MRRGRRRQGAAAKVIVRAVGGLAASALLLLTPISASPAEMEEEAFLWGRLTNLRTGAPVVTFSGNQRRQNPNYASTANLFRTPCPGRYEYLLETEAWPDGPAATATATATVILSPGPRSPAIACGEALPPRPGRFEATIANLDEPLALRGERNGSGPFVGFLALGVEPECNLSYTLAFAVDLDGWRRSLRYRMDVQRVEFTRQGNPEPRLSCADAES